MSTHEELARLMEFDHPVRVDEQGNVTDGLSGIYAPDMRDDALESDSDTWELLKGFSGQHSYHGPTMHASEYIGGGLADYILSNPGVYVAIISFFSQTEEEELESPDSDIGGWAIARLK